MFGMNFGRCYCTFFFAVTPPIIAPTPPVKTPPTTALPIILPVLFFLLISANCVLSNNIFNFYVNNIIKGIFILR